MITPLAQASLRTHIVVVRARLIQQRDRARRQDQGEVCFTVYVVTGFIRRLTAALTLLAAGPSGAGGLRPARRERPETGEGPSGDAS